jgi:hypothetical protein
MQSHVCGYSVLLYEVTGKARCQFPALLFGQLSGQGKLKLAGYSGILPFLCSFGGVPKLLTAHIYAMRTDKLRMLYPLFAGVVVYLACPLIFETHPRPICGGGCSASSCPTAYGLYATVIACHFS